MGIQHDAIANNDYKLPFWVRHEMADLWVLLFRGLGFTTGIEGFVDFGLRTILYPGEKSSEEVRRGIVGYGN